MSLLLDTNVLIRFVTGEPEAQAKEVFDLVTAADSGSVRLTLTALVVSEAVFVLTSFYKHPRAAVASALVQFLTSPGFDTPEKERLEHALKLFGAGKIDFVDCYLAAASIQDQSVVVSFDKDFDKLHGVTRKRPADCIG